MKLKLASIRSTQRMHYGGEGVMTPPRAPHPRHVRYSARWQARFDGETRAKIEELACIFHRKRGPVLRYVIRWRLTQTRGWTVDMAVPGTVRTVGMLLEPELLQQVQKAAATTGRRRPLVASCVAAGDLRGLPGKLACRNGRRPVA
jgi:hypothetical protein